MAWVPAALVACVVCGHQQGVDMATGIPLPSANFGAAFSSGADSIIKNLMDQQQLAQQRKYQQGQLGIQQQAQDRAQQEWEMKKSQYDMLQRMMNGEPAQPMPTQEYGQGMGMFTPDGMQDAQQQKQQQPQGDMNAFLQTPMGRGLYHQVYGIDPLSHTDVLTGPAREAMDLERLKQQQGENSPVYQMAKANMEAKQQSRQDVSETRQARLGGLKPGERWIKDPESGQPIGKEIPLTSTERSEAKGRGFFNHAFDHISRGLAPLSGEGSIGKLADAASQYGQNPEATRIVDDYLLGQKLLTAGVIKEAATLASGKQKATYQQLRESLDSSDIPKIVSKVVKQFGLPPTAAMKADMRFKQVLNDATKAGERSVPAYSRNLFNPESQKFEKESGEDDVSETVLMTKNGKMFNIPANKVSAAEKAGYSRG